MFIGQPWLKSQSALTHSWITSTVWVGVGFCLHTHSNFHTSTSLHFCFYILYRFSKKPNVISRNCFWWEDETFGHFPAMQSSKCHHQILSWDNSWLQTLAKKRLLVIVLGTTLYSNLSKNFSLFIWLPDIFFSFCRYTQSLHTDLCVYKYITSKRSSKVGGCQRAKVLIMCFDQEFLVCS